MKIPVYVSGWCQTLREWRGVEYKISVLGGGEILVRREDYEEIQQKHFAAPQAPLWLTTDEPTQNATIKALTKELVKSHDREAELESEIIKLKAKLKAVRNAIKAVAAEE